MKQIILIATIIVAAIMLTGCGEMATGEYKWRETNDLQLRQLVNDTKVQSSSSGSFFLIAGGYRSNTSEVYTVKVFANLNGDYMFLEYPLDDVRVRINDSIETPYARIRYKSSFPNTLDELLYGYGPRELIIVCPSKYLPEQLIPIKL